MTKRMLIDSTLTEETRVVVINGNKLEDVEFETSHRRQIKGNIYLAKVMRVEPSLQACFVDYGGNKHGFLAFGEIHPDFYKFPKEDVEAVEKEVDEIIEAKKKNIRDREAERERIREEKAAAYAKRQTERTEANALAKTEKNTAEASQIDMPDNNNVPLEANGENLNSNDETTDEEDKKHPLKKRQAKKRTRRQKEHKDEIKVLSESTGFRDESVSDDGYDCRMSKGSDDDEFDDDDDDEQDVDFELQKKLLRARKLFHKSKIQDVIKEGQILLVQVVKEERGNKGAALTTYLSLAGRYCVLMPNRIKSGGVSRKITNVADRKRLKSIVKELPLSLDMSLIVRTAGEEKTKADVVRDYNYLIRSWNLIRLGALRGKAPEMIHEEGNLIKRALRDIYTKEIAEILVAGDEGYKMAKEFFRILSPHSLKKIKHYRNSEMPLFQRFQVEGQLDKLHDPNVQLESGGYLVINPTEALVSIDVNSGRATKEKDLEETALRTNLEACDEIARQLRLRNLAGLVVVDFIDMDEQSNNHAIEKRMKEALKKDRSRIQIAKMSCFGLLEISRQRMHSSFMESNYQVCPHCHGQGMIRTIESSAVFVLRGIEEEGIKGRSSRINVYIPSEIAIYLLNQKRQVLIDLEQRYKLNVIISADDTVQHISDYRVERTKSATPLPNSYKPAADEEIGISDEDASPEEKNSEERRDNRNNDRRDSRNRNRDRNRNRERNNDRRDRRDEVVTETSEERPAQPQLQPQAERSQPHLENTENEVKSEVNTEATINTTENNGNSSENDGNENRNRRRRDRRNRHGRNRDRDYSRREYNNSSENGENRSENRESRPDNRENRNNRPANHERKSEAIILYNSHEDIKPRADANSDSRDDGKGKTNWWKKLIKS